jgi:hypothetical protein
MRRIVMECGGLLPPCWAATRGGGKPPHSKIMRALLPTSLLLLAVTAAAQRVAINDLGTGLYLGQFEGGLYENGSDQMPADHRLAEMQHEAAVQPLDRDGNPSADGKIILLSIGMSNTTQEFCASNNPAPCAAWSFSGQAASDPSVNHRALAIVNGARGGQTASTWDSPTDTNYNQIRDINLMPSGFSERQVQAVWLKVANAQPSISLPSPNADAYQLVRQMGNIVRALKTRYSNLQLVFISSRIYAGYATTTLNPEPYAYESGFAVKWVIAAQIEQRRSARVDPTAGNLDDRNNAGPWVGWGAYLWADGMNARADGLTWSRADLAGDGTHPSQSGQQKVGAMLLDFFKRQSWFLAERPSSRRRAARP